MADKKEPEVPKGKANGLNDVHADMNWRSYIANELNCAERWHNDWGFLAGGVLEKGKFHFRHKNRTK